MTTLALALVAAAAAATPAPTPPSLDVGGAVSLGETGELDVRVDLTNRGGQAAGPVTIAGELAGHYDEAKVAEGIGPGVTSSARLRFPRDVQRPGVYPVSLLLDYAPRAATGGAPAVSQRAFLLLTIGAAAPAPVHVSAPEVALRDRVLLPVTMESADGRAHRVRLRVLTPRGLNPERAEDELAVPASGKAAVSVPLLRGTAPRPSRQGLLLVVETLDGDVAQASTSTTVVSVAAPNDVLPGLRVPLAVAGVLLLVLAAVVEWRHRRRARATVEPAV